MHRMVLQQVMDDPGHGQKRAADAAQQRNQETQMHPGQGLLEAQAQEPPGQIQVKGT